jgi:hypothetical protein
VAGTPLKAAALELKTALEPFATAYRHIKCDLPTALEPDQLNNFANKGYRVGMATRRVALAIEGFIDELQPTANVK